MDRNLSLWNLEAVKKKDSVGTFLLDDLAVTLDVKFHQGNLQILATSRNGVVHIFSESLEKVLNSVKPIKARWRISLVSDDKKTAESLPVVAAKFTDSVLLAYGGSGCLRFESLTPKQEEPHEILIRDDPRKVKGGKEAAKHVLVDHTKVDYVLGGETKKTLKTIEIPMEKRLENLALSKDQGAGTVTPAKNMHYLIQALHSRDPKILQDVLLTKDKNSIRTTLKYLPPQYIRPLINELTTLMQKKLKNVECATHWMKVLIELHVGQLMAVGSEDLRSQMKPFLGIVEHRVSNLQALTRVRGRLDLILSQIRGNSEVDRDEIAKINKNLIVHQDEASDSDSEIGLEETNNDEDGWEEDSSEGSGSQAESEDSEEVDEEMAENDEEMEVSD
uniref:Small-subunit processome Utp12 domain-containing protein n=2 Tax=Phlebotomus papatasi TaxID=29031 RepID=A0A1B0EZ96_PHLPP